jgi:hypothetical protein
MVSNSSNATNDLKDAFDSKEKFGYGKIQDFKSIH